MKSPLYFLVPLMVGFAGASSPAAPQASTTRPERPPALVEYQNLAQAIISGDRAREMVAFMDPTYRVPGNESFNSSIEEVARALEAAGYVAEAEGVGGPLTYRIERREMTRPAWDPLDASLRIVGQANPLMTLASNINLMAAYSHSTPADGLEAELVDVGRGTPDDFEGIDVHGKIVLGDGSPGQLFRRAVQEHGALGVLAYRLSSFSNPEVNRDIAPMSSIPYDAEAKSWGFALSLTARDALRSALAAGPVRVRVEVESRIYPSEELTLVAEVRGTSTPEERFVFSAHVQESGANDNASGVQHDLGRRDFLHPHVPGRRSCSDPGGPMGPESGHGGRRHEEDRRHLPHREDAGPFSGLDPGRRSTHGVGRSAHDRRTDDPTLLQ